VSTAFHIIVADDDPYVLRTIVRRLARAFPTADISSVPDGEAALACMAQGGADILVLDNNMPRLNGLEVIRELRSLQDLVPIIMVSGDALVERDARAAVSRTFCSKEGRWRS
jgi:CheY-like chemotaxis protein